MRAAISQVSTDPPPADAKKDSKKKDDYAYEDLTTFTVDKKASPMRVARYHSLVIADVGTHPHLVVSARTEDDGTIMGVRHVTYPVHGVQFHPESVLTGEGKHMLRNFLEV